MEQTYTLVVGYLEHVSKGLIDCVVEFTETEVGMEQTASKINKISLDQILVIREVYEKMNEWELR